MRILVVGGAGMLGSAVVQQLAEAGHEVRSLDRDPIQQSPVEVEAMVGDVRSAEAVRRACAGMDAVIHTVAQVDQLPGKSRTMYDINVGGVENVIAACQAEDVSRLVYTSSVDVVFNGAPIANGDETLPYPKRYLDYYSLTKRLGEQAVIAANGMNGLATCSIRSAGLYGPNDRHRLPRVIPQVQTSGTFTRIGDGRAQFNHVYIDNMAHAHRIGVEQLTPDAACAGQCYFITEGTQGNFFAFVQSFVDGLNIPYKESVLPEGTAMLLARIMETAYWLQPPARRRPPAITRYAVAATARDFWFNHRKAERDLGYAPIVDVQTAFDRTLAWAREAFRPSA